MGPPIRFGMPSVLGRRFQVDFVQPKAPVAPIAWILLAVGSIALAGATASFMPRWVEYQSLVREREQLQARADRVPGIARPAAHSPDLIGLSQARAVLEELDRPWPQLFDQLEAAQVPDVHLVQLGVDTHFQAAQMVAEAPKLEQVLQYSKRLAARGPVRSVRLTHHEWRSVPAGRVVVADLTANLGPFSATDRGQR